MVNGLTLSGVNTLALSYNLKNYNNGNKFQILPNDVFEKSYCIIYDSEDKEILFKLKKDIENCKREDFKTEEEYRTTLNARIEAYNKFNEKVKGYEKDKNEQQISTLERGLKAAGNFAKDIGEAISKGGKELIELLGKIANKFL